MKNNYMVGQRVILIGLGGVKEIGTVVRPENSNAAGDVWVFSPTREYASCYAYHNVKPLPKGQV